MKTAIVLRNRCGCELHRKTVERTDDYTAAVVAFLRDMVLYEGDTIRLEDSDD